jgi:signal transduction histidine kinase
MDMQTLLPAFARTDHPVEVELQESSVANDPVALLLVDDDPRNLDVLGSILDAPDYRLVRAQTPEEALLALISGDFAVIVLDIRMPGMNGLELAQIIKERKKTQHIPIIFLTAYYQENDHVMHGYDAGAVDYLTKPCNPVVLRSKVSVFVNLFRKTRALQAEINERKRLETEIARAIEREQLRLGQELHDGLSQQLTGIGFMMKAMETKLQKVSPALARESGRLELLIRQTIDQSRDLAKGFYPVELERLGLAAALQEIPRHLKQLSTIDYVVETDENVACASLKGTQAVQLFRIAQEAAHNAVKHAKAKRVVVRLVTVDDHIILTIKDDGIGLNRDTGAKTGMGLTIMRYRARMVGGSLDIRNAEDCGVIVTCSVPNVSGNGATTTK